MLQEGKTTRKLERLETFRRVFVTYTGTYPIPDYTPTKIKSIMHRLSAINYTYSERHYELNNKISHRATPKLQ